MTNYLWQNMQPCDMANAKTLGFHNEDTAWNGSSVSETDGAPTREATQPCVDGLSDGILKQTLHFSIQAKILYPWTDHVPRKIYLEYVLPYCVVNEPRTDHRTLLFEKLEDIPKDFMRKDGVDMHLQGARASIKAAVEIINTDLWSVLGRKGKPISFKAGLTPRIYDPLSVIAYGYSSCTGLAILLISALRSVGIACRMAGTPAWNGDANNGNHSWVEVYLPSEAGGEWVFMEPSPGIAEGAEDSNADHLDREPMKRWFCNPSRMDGITSFYATRYDRSSTTVHFPLAWSVSDEGVVGEDRSSFYNSIFGK